MLCDHVGLSVILSVYLCATLLQKWLADFIKTWWYDWTYQSEGLINFNFWWRSIPDTDSESLLHFLHHCWIKDLRFYWHFSYSHWPVFTTLREMTDGDGKGDGNECLSQQFGSDPADIRIQIWFRIPDHFWFWLRVGLSGVCALWVPSGWYC